ncbi:MAG TPA: YbaB/EbfC family nucleoid-associated protein [Natronosporangium sp.]
MQALMQQAAQLQEQFTSAQSELADAEVTGTAGGGLVKATLAGTGEVKAIKIDPSAVDPDDVETLEDLIVAALHAATEEQQRLAQQKLGPLAGGLAGGSPGGLPGLPGF